MRQTIGSRALISFALLASPVSSLAAQEIDYFGSMQYARGSYIFTQSTNSWSLTNGVSFRSSRLRLFGSLPLVYQNSGAVSWIGGVPVPTGGDDHGAVANRPSGGHDVPMGRNGSGSGAGARSGHGPAARAFARSVVAAGDTVEAPGDYELNAGDPVLGGGFEILRSNAGYGSIELTGSVKPPLATVESGVGTGEWDYAAGLTAAASAGPALMLFADVAYWWYGDMADLPLRDGLAWGGGIGGSLSPRVSALLALSGSQHVIDDVDARVSPHGVLLSRDATPASTIRTPPARRRRRAADLRPDAAPPRGGILPTAIATGSPQRGAGGGCSVQAGHAHASGGGHCAPQQGRARAGGQS